MLERTGTVSEARRSAPHSQHLEDRRRSSRPAPNQQVRPPACRFMKPSTMRLHDRGCGADEPSRTSPGGRPQRMVSRARASRSQADRESPRLVTSSELEARSRVAGARPSKLAVFESVSRLARDRQGRATTIPAIAVTKNIPVVPDTPNRTAQHERRDDDRQNHVNPGTGFRAVVAIRVGRHRGEEERRTATPARGRRARRARRRPGCRRTLRPPAS